MSPVEKETDFTCVPIATPGPTMAGAVGGCDFQATLLRLRKKFEGGGFYVLSEYTIDGPGLSLRRRKRRRGAAPGDLPVLRELGRDQARSAARSSTRSTSSAACDCMFQSETREASAQAARRVRDQLRPHAREAARQVRQARQLRAARPGGHRNPGGRLVRRRPIASSASGAGARRAIAACTPPARPASCCRSIPRPAWARCCIRRRCSGSSPMRARTTASRATGSSRCCTPASSQVDLSARGGK